MSFDVNIHTIDHRNIVGNVTYYKTLKFLQENICPSGACILWTQSVAPNTEHVRWYWHVQGMGIPPEAQWRWPMCLTTKHHQTQFSTGIVFVWSLVLTTFMYSYVWGHVLTTACMWRTEGNSGCQARHRHCHLHNHLTHTVLLILNIWGLFSIKDRTHVMSKISFLIYSLSLMLLRNFHRLSF